VRSFVLSRFRHVAPTTNWRYQEGAKPSRTWRNVLLCRVWGPIAPDFEIKATKTVELQAANLAKKSDSP
jgi:hypothetical protein